MSTVLAVEGEIEEDGRLLVDLPASLPRGRVRVTLELRVARCCSPRTPRRPRRTLMLCDSNVWPALVLSKHMHQAAARQ